MAQTTKRQYRPGMTAFGTFKYSKISEPDTKGKYADGKYKSELVLDAEDTKAFTEELKTAAKEMLPGVDDPHLPIKKDKKDGTISFMFKSTKKPVVVDAKRNALPAGTKVRSGSTGRFSYTLTNYDKGLSLWLDAVQVTELAQGSPGADAFSETEGYESEQAPAEQDAASAQQSAADKFKL